MSNRFPTPVQIDAAISQARHARSASLSEWLRTMLSKEDPLIRIAGQTRSPRR